MTLPNIKLKLVSPPNVQVKLLPRYPVRMQGDGGIVVTTANGITTVEPDVGDLNPVEVLENGTDLYFWSYSATMGYARFSAQAIVNYLGVGYQPLDPTLTALAAVETVGNELIYATGSDTFTTTPFTAYGRTLIATTDESNFKEAVNLEIGVDVAPVDSPDFTGTPTAPTATAGTNTTQIATTQFVRTEVANLVDSAPSTLDTLNELAAALGDDPNFATTVTNALAGKQPLDSDLTALAAMSTTGIVERTGAATYATLTASGVLDKIGATRGAVLYRGASGWALLTPGDSGDVLTSNGTGADPGWAAPDVGGSAFVPRGHLFGMVLANNTTDANNDIDISAGETASEDTTPFLIVLESGITKRLDEAWSAGTGNGGLDTGSKAADTTYHVFAIAMADGTSDVLFSTSLNSPTLPDGYVYKRRIGSILTASNANIYGFTQIGDRFLWNSAKLDVNTSSLGTSASTANLTVPTGVKVKAFLNAQIFKSGANPQAYIFSPDQSTPGSLGTGGTIASMRAVSTSVTAVNGYIEADTNTSGQVRVLGSESSITLAVSTLGYEDLRGRLA